MRVLIAEDKLRMATLLQRAIQREGYTTLVAHDGEAALSAMEHHHVDALVMDVMMPKLDGFAVLACMRRQQLKTPTILLTARDTSEDVVRGLDLGADDYLTKPFELSVLLARLRAVTRRPAGLMLGPDLQVGKLTLRQHTHDVLCAGTSIALTRLEYTLLEALMQRAGQVVRKETLAEIGWGSEQEMNENTLYVFISSLRTKLQAAGQQDLLRTVRGVGYVLRARVAA